MVLEGGSDQSQEIDRKLKILHIALMILNIGKIIGYVLMGNIQKMGGWIGTLEREDFEKNNFRNGWDIDYDSILPHYIKTYRILL